MLNITISIPRKWKRTRVTVSQTNKKFPSYYNSHAIFCSHCGETIRTYLMRKVFDSLLYDDKVGKLRRKHTHRKSAICVDKTVNQTMERSIDELQQGFICAHFHCDNISQFRCEIAKCSLRQNGILCEKPFHLKWYEIEIVLYINQKCLSVSIQTKCRQTGIFNLETK